MRPSPLLAAAAAAALLAGVAGPAGAADPVPARGEATSSVTLLELTAGGREVTAGTLALLSETLGAPRAQALLTPLTVDGTAYGQRTVTPADGPTSAPSLSSGSVVPALAGLLEVAAPTLSASSSTSDSSAQSEAGADSLGGVSLLGIPLALGGGLDAGAAVDQAGAAGTQALAVTDLALPSIADLLAALGLDLTKLPTDVLVELLDGLDLLTPAVTAASTALTDATAALQAQIDAAQAALDAATADLAAATAALTGPQSDLAAAEADLADATAALAPLTAEVTAAQDDLTAATAELAAAQALLDGALTAAGLADLAAYEALPPLLRDPLRPLIDPLVADVTAAQAAVTTATGALAAATADLAAAQSLADAAAAAVAALQATVDALQAAVDAAQALVDDLTAALAAVLDDLQPLVDALVDAVLVVLDGTPLVSLDSLEVLTRATAVSAAPGGQAAEVVGGQVVGLRVLGTDVLADVLGSSSVDLLDLTGDVLADVQGAVGALTGTLSDVLSTVPGFPALSVPAPTVGLMTEQTSTGVSGGFGTAGTVVRALSVTLPAITVPSALAVPGAADLPALSGVTQVAGQLSSAPVELGVGRLDNAVRFAPAVAGTTTPPTTAGPGTGTGIPTAGGRLPATGGSEALAALAVALLVGAAVVRRRRPVEEPAG